MEAKNKTQQYFNKLAQLSQEVDFYFSSEVLSKFIGEVNIKHDLPSGYVADLITEAVVVDFNFPALEEKIKIDLKLDNEKTKQIFLDILGAIFLPIDDYLAADIKREIEGRGGEVRQYQKYIDEFSEAVENENFNLIDELVKKHEELVDPEKEKNTALDLFQNYLVDILKTKAGESFSDLNGGLIYLLYNVRGFKEEILKILLNSQKKLTSQEFVLDGKREEPTVANWLRDFIKSEGSDLFDELALSKYLINSPNAKKLDEEEKKLLRKLLILYRNLKFFPESLADLPPEEWEIIPIEKAAEELSKARTVSEPLKIVKEEKVMAKTSAFPPLPKEYEKEDLAKAAPAGVGSAKEEELPNIGSLISQARKEAEEKLAEESSAPMLIKSTTLTLEEIANQAERAISELKISLDPEEKNRLKNILVSFLKGIRNSIETKDALLKSKEEGGLNFTPQQVEQVFNLIKMQKPLKKEGLIKEKTFGVSFDEQMKDILRPPSEDVIARSEATRLAGEASEVVPKADPPLADNLSEIATRPLNKLEVARNDKKEEVLSQLQPPPPAILETFREKLKEKITSQPALSQISPLSQESQPSQPFQESQSRSTPPPPSLVEASYGGQSPPTDREGEPSLRRSLGVRRAEIPEIKEIKPRLEDIKRPIFSDRRPKVELVGPIEEIRNLTLADLREMSDSPDRAFEKIKGKISLLEKESFLKRIQAIKAWREGEIYRLYVEIGREVIQKKSIIAKILKERSAKGLPILTEEEFSAIMDFNKSLRF